MKKIIDKTKYPANVIYSVFGECADDMSYYFDSVSAECDIEDITSREFDDIERKVFYARYKDGMTKHDITNELQISQDTVNEIIERIFARLIHPRVSKQLRKYADTVKVYEIDDGKSAAELVDMCEPVGDPVVVVKNGRVKAFVLNVREYDELIQKAAIVDKWEKEVKQKVQAESDMFRAAVRVVIDKGAVSAMLLQTELKIGYAHANRLIDEMEQCKFISPYVSGKKREVYIPEEQYDKLFVE